MRMKIVWSICVVSLCAIGYLAWYAYSHQNDNLKKIGMRNALERQAVALVEQGKYEEAVPILLEATKSQYINRDYERAHPVGKLVGVLKLQGKYEEALKAQAWFFVDNPNPEYAQEEKDEIEALIQYQKTGNPQSVQDYIVRMQKKYAKSLPPINYFEVGQISEFLRLYDTIGDMDGGIEYIDMCTKFFRDQAVADGTKFVPGPNYDEYLKVREAFEQDKKEGKKGRATQALIQSTYFPW